MRAACPSCVCAPASALYIYLIEPFGLAGNIPSRGKTVGRGTGRRAESQEAGCPTKDTPTPNLDPNPLPPARPGASTRLKESRGSRQSRYRLTMEGETTPMLEARGGLGRRMGGGASHAACAHAGWLTAKIRRLLSPWLGTPTRTRGSQGMHLPTPVRPGGSQCWPGPAQGHAMCSAARYAMCSVVTPHMLGHPPPQPLAPPGRWCIPLWPSFQLTTCPCLPLPWRLPVSQAPQP